MAPSPLLSIGELSRRTGLSVSAIRFYEARGLVTAVRSAGNQRRFLRADIRRLSFALIAQQLGLTLAEIEAELATLPQGRAPSRQDWQAISRRIRGATPGTHRPAGKDPRAARRLHRLRLPVACQVPALQSRRPRGARRGWSAFPARRSAAGFCGWRAYDTSFCRYASAAARSDAAPAKPT
jgi:DNA-binding transcriptional MerR regulator